MTARWFGEGVGQEANESIKQAYEQAAPMEGGPAPRKTSLKRLYGLLPESAR